MKTIKIIYYGDRVTECEMSDLLSGREMTNVLRTIEVAHGQKRREHQRKLRAEQMRNDILTQDVKEKENGERKSRKLEPKPDSEPKKLQRQTSLAGAIERKRAEANPKREGQSDPTRTGALGAVKSAQAR